MNFCPLCNAAGQTSFGDNTPFIDFDCCNLTYDPYFPRWISDLNSHYQIRYYPKEKLVSLKKIGTFEPEQLISSSFDDIVEALNPNSSFWKTYMVFK